MLILNYTTIINLIERETEKLLPDVNLTEPEIRAFRITYPTLTDLFFHYTNIPIGYIYCLIIYSSTSTGKRIKTNQHIFQ